MKKTKRVLAMLLAIVMVLSIAPMSVVQAAAEDVTEAITDFVDELAFGAEDLSAEELTGEPAAGPAETEAPVTEPEQSAAPTEEPAAEETAAEPTAANETEPAETEAPAVEAEQAETEAPATEPEQTAAAPETKAQTAEQTTAKPTTAGTETTTKASARAIKKAARRAPLRADGPEFNIGLMSVVDPTTQLITAIDVPPTLYCDANGSIYTSTGADGFAKTNDKYYTAISVTTALGVSNVKLYLVDSSDAYDTYDSGANTESNARISLDSLSGTTWNYTFPSGKSVSVSNGFGMVRYRLEYDYEGKTYTAYAASCVKVKYHTASAWLSQNGTTANATVQIDTRMIVDVSELLGQKGVSAVTSLYTNDLAKYKSDHNTSATLSAWSQPINSFSADVYGPGKASWNGGTANSPTFSGNPGTPWVYSNGADSNWLSYSAIDYYFGANGSVNSGNINANANTDYAGMSLLINRASTSSSNANFTGLYGAQSTSDISGVNGSTSYVMAHVYYDPYVVNYSGKTSADADTLRITMEKGNKTPDGKTPDQ